MPEPPKPWTKGRTYETVSERCAACQMQGGDEDPCMSGSALDAYATATGRDCPFVALSPANALISEAVCFAFDERLRGFAVEIFNASTANVDAATRYTLLVRLGNVLWNKRVTDTFYPERNRG